MMRCSRTRTAACRVHTVGCLTFTLLTILAARGVAPDVGGFRVSVIVGRAIKMFANLPDMTAWAATSAATGTQGQAPDPAPGLYTRWLADGATGPNIDTRIAIANPGPRTAVVRLIFIRSDGERVTSSVRVAPGARATIIPASISALEAAAFSTRIESDQPVAVDGSMSWNGSGYAGHTETSVPAPSTTWFFAEGATHSGFNLVYTIQNPASIAADVQMRYLRPAPAPPLSKMYRVPANSRITIRVNTEARSDPALSALAATDVAASMISSVPVIAERAMYLDGTTALFGERHGNTGMTAPSTDWYFAEGRTGSQFDLFLRIANPNEAAADVEVRYLLPSGAVITRHYVADGNSRFDVRVDSEDQRHADTAVSMAIKSTNGIPIVVERSMSWPGATAAAWQNPATGAGATATATTWTLAEGEVGGFTGAETYILLANTSETAGLVTITLLFEDGTIAAKQFAILATSRLTVNVGEEFPSADGKRFGAVAESLGDPAARLVVERSMYSNPGGVGRVAGSTAAATPFRITPTPGVQRTTPAISSVNETAAVEPVSATAGPTAGAAAFNLRLVSDASPDLSDQNSLIYSTTSRWTSIREKVWSLFYWSRILKRQTSPMVLHGFDVTDPIRNFADYGFTQCSTISGINQSLYETLGLRHQYWDICNHTVSNVEYDGAFHMIDSSMSSLVTTDDGVTLASIQQAAADSARLVRERSLYSTSANGFLTGSDANRNLTDAANPVSGTIATGFSRAFCETGLKFRDYYYNWNSGHRYVLNLRESESYTRYYRRLGATADYWVGSEKISAPDPSQTYEIDALNRFGIRGNGSWSFTPKMTAAAWAGSAYGAKNITAVTAGLRPSAPGTTAEVVYKVQAANAITSQKIQAQFARSDALATATIAVSLNHGATWTQVADVGTAVGTVPVAVNLRNQVSGAYETLIRIRMSVTSSAPSGVVLARLTIDTLTQVNTKALPRLNLGRNEIFVGQGERSDTMVLWPDLRGDLWKKDIYDSANIASQPVNVPRGYTAVVYPAALTQDAYLTYRMTAPTDITRLVYGGRLHNFRAGSYIDFLHSFDGGATWIRSYRLSSTSKPYDVIHYETVTGIPAGVKTVLFKFLIHNTNTTTMRASGLYAVRMEANYRPLNAGTKPLDVTLRWKEVRSDRTLVGRSHRQRVSAFPFKYVINVGGSDHPIMESVKLTLEDQSDTTPYGYGDGVDAGGQKYVAVKRTDGTNVAKNRPYTISRPPSGFQSSAGAGNTTLLTDGVVGAPATGGTSYWWGQCWSSGRDVDVQIDLGQTRTVAAFRAHLFGYPFWDALKGQVQDRVEVLTSTDGVTFTSRGLLQTSLWKKDVPINYMLQDDEKATAWNFERKIASPVLARYVRYHVTPKRSLCVSEMQVLDSVADTPFDLRIALPPR
jgi:hypothetical protein